MNRRLAAAVGRRWVLLACIAGVPAFGCSLVLETQRLAGHDAGDVRLDGDGPEFAENVLEVDEIGEAVEVWVCGSNTDCDNGNPCDGLETCWGGACVAGTSPCNDGIDCTLDPCSPSGMCGTPVPDDTLCGMSQYCNPANGCCYRSEFGRCSNGADDDCDGTIDCADADCAADAACCTAVACGGGCCPPGNDCCLDATGPRCFPSTCRGCCQYSATCTRNEIGSCGDGIDNDCDGWTDCGDSECQYDPVCACPGGGARCGDGGACCTGGLTPGCCVYPAGGTCYDAACLSCCMVTMCSLSGEVDCTNGLDDDCDLLVDCQDTDCAADPSCPTH